MVKSKDGVVQFTDEELRKMDSDFLRVISDTYFGYLVGRVKEHLEASIENDRQLTALRNVIADTMYDWWRNIGDKLSSEEFSEASKKHWANLK